MALVILALGILALIILALGILALGIMTLGINYVLTPISWYFYHFKSTSVLGLGYFQYQGFRKNTFRIPPKIQLSSVQ